MAFIRQLQFFYPSFAKLFLVWFGASHCLIVLSKKWNKKWISDLCKKGNNNSSYSCNIRVQNVWTREYHYHVLFFFTNSTHNIVPFASTREFVAPSTITTHLCVLSSFCMINGINYTCLWYDTLLWSMLITKSAEWITKFLILFSPLQQHGGNTMTALQC